jgi:tetratricopeptide (TPR) repeat protein
MTTMRATRLAALVLAAGLASGASLGASQRSESLRREAYAAAYNMDHERASELFRQAIAADQNDAAAHRGAAAVSWLRVLFLRGTVLAEDYSGHIKSSSDVQMPAPPPALDTAFHRDIDRAIALGEKAVARRYNDASSHYDLGAGLGLYASYAGTVEGRIFAALKFARRAFSENEKVLELDPQRKDAGLVLGTYRYLVSTLPMPVRWMAYIVGFGGGKEEGIRLIEDAAGHPSELQTDAKFALVLLYNRERRYADAVDVLRGLERSYPRNRLLILEEASTLLRDKRPGEAEQVLDDGIARLRQDPRERMPGEEGRWHYKRGMARLLVGKLNGAEEDLRLALGAKDVRGWVLARIHVELGKLADLRGDRGKAQGEYRTALAITNTSSDDQAESDATRLLAQPYKQ